MVRSFLAVPLPETLIAELARLRRQLATRLPEVRWVRPETIHLTLRFFGDLTEESLEKIGEIMLSIGRLHAPFAVDLAGLGTFPRADRARVFWLGLGPSAPLLGLYRDLEQGLAALDLPAESRPFTPHLTLGRHRGKGLAAAPLLDEFAAPIRGVLPVARMVLYESRLEPSGARHLPRREVPLCGPTH